MGTDTFILISSKTFVLSHIDGGMGKKKKVIFMMNIPNVIKAPYTCRYRYMLQQK